jgi:hypothetical protein
MIRSRGLRRVLPSSPVRATGGSSASCSARGAHYALKQNRENLSKGHRVPLATLGRPHFKVQQCNTPL